MLLYALIIITLGTWHRFLWPKLPSPGWIRCPPGPRTPRADTRIMIRIIQPWNFTQRQQKKNAGPLETVSSASNIGVISGIYATAKGYISLWTWSPELSMIFWMKQYAVPSPKVPKNLRKNKRYQINSKLSISLLLQASDRCSQYIPTSSNIIQNVLTNLCMALDSTRMHHNDQRWSTHIKKLQKHQHHPKNNIKVCKELHTTYLTKLYN